jgi:acyl-coenzyme A thioesterase PaaI-like protein
VTDDPMPEQLLRLLRPEDPSRVIGRGHPVGDILEADEWSVLERGLGHLRVSAHLPVAVRNPRGQLFGGFTGTYVDFMSLFTYWAGREAVRGEQRRWLATLNMRVDYFRPVMGPRFEMEGRVVYRRGSTGMVETRFFEEGAGPEGEPLVFAYTTVRVTG